MTEQKEVFDCPSCGKQHEVGITLNRLTGKGCQYFIVKLKESFELATNQGSTWVDAGPKTNPAAAPLPVKVEVKQ